MDDALGLRAAPQGRRCPPSRTRPGRGTRSTASSWPGSRPRGSHPRPRPSRRRSIRRVTLDLTGLPPTPAEVDAFLADTLAATLTRRWSTGCSSRRATASTWPGSGSTPPATATPTACTWTTTARSGPTATGSSRRSTPTSRSTSSSSSSSPATCCPNPTLDQLVATGFNRCHVTTSEGGSIEEEVYVRNVVDQVDTNGTVFLGLTVGCARCHDHKYDPIRTKDYYQLFAFFNNIDGPALDGNVAQSGADRQGADRRAEGRARSRRRRRSPRCARRSPPRRPRPWPPTTARPTPSRARSSERGGLRLDRRRPARRAPRRQGRRPVGVRRPARSSGLQRPGVAANHGARGSSSGSSTTPGRKLKVGEGDKLFAYVYLDPLNPPKEIMLQWHTGGAGRTGPTGART